MLARLEGQVVLVSGTIPGERVTAEVEQVRKGVVYAQCAAVAEPQHDRRPVDGDPACGGNVFAHIVYERQVRIKADIIADAFARIGRLPIDDVRVRASPERGYRMRARVHGRGGRIGYFREGSHEVCDAAATGQLLDATGHVLHAIGGVIAPLPSTAAIDLQLMENLDASQRALHVGIPAGAPWRRDVARLAAIPGVTGVSVDVPYGRTPHVIHGSPYVADSWDALIHAAPARGGLRRHAASFFQGNRFLLKDLVERVVALTGDGPFVDLYAGVGLFGCALAASGRTGITAVEGDRTSGADLRANAALFDDAVHVRTESVEQFVSGSTDSPGTLIVDPPRTGMSREALEGAIRLNARTVVYVSCDVATVARDARRLVDAGYMLQSVEGFDLFPNTAHVEIVARFERA
jgi:23S rRNA (uracil1939-C5)-methyltransferase